MTKLSKWEVNIEYGPDAGQSHCIVVDTDSAEEARELAATWATTNSVHYPLIGQPVKVDMTDEVPMLDDDFTDIVEWSPEEEEEFLRIFGNDTRGNE